MKTLTLKLTKKEHRELAKAAAKLRTKPEVFAAAWLTAENWDRFLGDYHLVAFANGAIARRR